MSIFLDKTKIIKKICENSIKNDYPCEEMIIFIKEIIPLICDFGDKYKEREKNENGRERAK